MFIEILTDASKKSKLQTAICLNLAVSSDFIKWCQDSSTWRVLYETSTPDGLYNLLTESLGLSGIKIEWFYKYYRWLCIGWHRTRFTQPYHIIFDNGVNLKSGDCIDVYRSIDEFCFSRQNKFHHSKNDMEKKIQKLKLDSSWYETRKNGENWENGINSEEKKNQCIIFIMNIMEFWSKLS